MQRADVNGDGNILVGRDVYIQTFSPSLNSEMLVNCPACETGVSPEAPSCPACGHPVKESLRLAKLSLHIAKVDRIGLVCLAIAAITMLMANIVTQSISHYIFFAALPFAIIGLLCNKHVEELKKPSRSP